MQPFRITPQMSAQNMKTYQILAPASSHFRPATCAEVHCSDWENGWKIRLEGLPPQLEYTARNAGKKFKELHISETENWLVYEAGQSCFKVSTHRTRLDRQEIYLVKDGDWRGNPRGTQARQHSSAADWVDDFATHQQHLADRLGQG